MPYLIIAYDVKTCRVQKLHDFLKGYLYWQQNSLFEGDVTEADKVLIFEKIEEIIDKDHDSVFCYVLATKKNLKKKIIGIEKKPASLIL